MNFIKKYFEFSSIFLNDIFQMIATFLSFAIISQLDLNFFALYALTLSALEIAREFSLFGNEKFFQKNIQNTNVSNQKFIDDSFSLNILLSLVSIFFFIIYKLFFDNSYMVYSFLIFIPILFHFKSLLILILKFERKNTLILKIRSPIIFLGLLFKYIIFLNNHEIFYICLIIFLEQIFEALALYFFAKKSIFSPQKISFDFESMFKLFQKLLPIGLSIVLFKILIRIEVFYLDLLLDPVFVGAFFLCLKIFSSMLLIPRSITTYLFPDIVKSSNEEVLSKFYNYYKKLIFAGLLGGLLIYIFGYFYVSYFINEDLRFSITYLPYFAAAFFFHSIGSIRNSFLIAINRQDEIFFPQLLSFIFKILISFLLILKYQFVGACLSFLIIEILNITFFNVFRKETRKILRLQSFTLKEI